MQITILLQLNSLKEANKLCHSMWIFSFLSVGVKILLIFRFLLMFSLLNLNIWYLYLLFDSYHYLIMYNIKNIKQVWLTRATLEFKVKVFFLILLDSNHNGQFLTINTAELKKVLRCSRSKNWQCWRSWVFYYKSALLPHIGEIYKLSFLMCYIILQELEGKIDNGVICAEIISLKGKGPCSKDL